MFKLCEALFGKFPTYFTKEMHDILREYELALQYVPQQKEIEFSGPNLDPSNPQGDWYRLVTKPREDRERAYKEKYPPEKYIGIMAEKARAKRIRGRQAKLTSHVPLLPTNTQTVVMNNVQFQIVNFDQDKKRKDVLVSSLPEGVTSESVSSGTPKNQFELVSKEMQFGFGTEEASSSQKITTEVSTPETTSKVKKQRKLQQKISIAD